jgi:uncharacterized membrane protein
MNGKYFLVGILLTVALSVAIVVAYPHLATSIPTHWNIHNQPNGHGPKWMLFVLGPGIMAATMLLMYFLPWLSPKNFEVEAFRSTFLQIMLILVSVFAYFDAVILWAALGHPINVGRAIVGGVCLLFATLGNLMGKVRRNFYVGIRTPWSLANERVWNATHRVAAKTFVLGGLLGFAVTLAGRGVPLVTFALAASALIPVVYSLTYYKQLQRRGEL